MQATAHDETLLLRLPRRTTRCCPIHGWRINSFGAFTWPKRAGPGLGDA